MFNQKIHQRCTMRPSRMLIVAWTLGTLILFGSQLATAQVAPQPAPAAAAQKSKPKKDLSGKIVLANIDKFPVTFRAGKTKKTIASKKASILGPKKYPVSFEVWSGNNMIKWQKVSLKKAGVYLFKFQNGRWNLAPRNAKPAGPPPTRVRPSGKATPGSTARGSTAKRTYQQGVGSRNRVVQRGGGTRVIVNQPRRGRWRGSYWHPLARGLWAAGSIYRFIRDEQDRDLFRRWIGGGIIDDAIRREWEDRIWDSIKDEAVNLPALEREELERAWDEFKGISDNDWKDAVNLPADEWDQIQDQLKDDFSDQDWSDLRDEFGDIGDNMDLQDTDIDSLDSAGIGDIDQDVDLGDLDDASLGDSGLADLSDEMDIADLGDFSMEAEDLDFGALSDLGGDAFDLSHDFDFGGVDGVGADSFDYGNHGWGGGNDWGGGDFGGGFGGDIGGGDWGGGDWGGGGWDAGGDFGGDFGGGDWGGGFDDFGGGGFDDFGGDFDF